VPVSIDRKLSLVVPIDDARGVEYRLYIAPLPLIVFQQHFRLFARVFDQLFAQGMGVAGTRVAWLLLRDNATQAGNWDELQGTLIAEMHRAALLLAPRADGGGYEQIPWDEAIARKMFSEEDVAEAENVIVFFTVSSAMTKQKQLKMLMDWTGGQWSAELTSLMPMEFAASLRTSTPAVSSAPTPGPQPSPSSIPS
jgi:hypothetical protein